MSTRLRLLATVLAGLLPVAHAAESAEVRVTATVINTCKIVATEDIGFGPLDPASATDVSAEGSVTIKCTKNADYVLAADGGLHRDGASGKRRMKGADAAFLPYAIAQDSFAGKGAGFSSPIRVALRATIAGADYRDLAADAYADTLRITINP